MERRPETNPSDTENRAELDRNSAPYIGGADAVEKTTYTSDVHGAEADGEARSPVRLTAAIGHDRGLGLAGWITLVLALLVLAAYAAGLFR